MGLSSRVHGLSYPGIRRSSGPGISPCPLHWRGGFLTSGPPGKSRFLFKDLNGDNQGKTFLFYLVDLQYYMGFKFNNEMVNIYKCNMCYHSVIYNIFAENIIPYLKLLLQLYISMKILYIVSYIYL